MLPAPFVPFVILSEPAKLGSFIYLLGVIISTESVMDCGRKHVDEKLLTDENRLVNAVLRAFVGSG